MAFFQTDKDKLVSAVQSVIDVVAALAVDPDPVPGPSSDTLQADLDAANARIAELQSKIDTALAHMQAASDADTAEDQARSDAINALK